VNIATVRRLPVPGAKVPATTLPNSRGIFYSLSVNFIFYNIFQGSSSATSKLQAELVPRTVNGTGHTGPSEFCATSI